MGLYRLTCITVITSLTPFLPWLRAFRMHHVVASTGTPSGLQVWLVGVWWGEYKPCKNPTCCIPRPSTLRRNPDTASPTRPGGTKTNRMSRRPEWFQRNAVVSKCILSRAVSGADASVCSLNHKRSQRKLDFKTGALQIAWVKLAVVRRWHVNGTGACLQQVGRQ